MRRTPSSAARQCPAARARASAGRPSCNLELDATHTWRVRAIIRNPAGQMANGPWSSAASFKSPLGGYIRGNELFDPLYNGTTVGQPDRRDVRAEPGPPPERPRQPRHLCAAADAARPASSRSWSLGVRRGTPGRQDEDLQHAGGRRRHHRPTTTASPSRSAVATTSRPGAVTVPHHHGRRGEEDARFTTAAASASRFQRRAAGTSGSSPGARGRAA